MFRESLRAFLLKEVKPYIDQRENEGEIPQNIYKKFWEMGYFGLDFDEAYGGSAADMWYTVITQEEMAGFNSGSFATAMGAHFFNALIPINGEGNEDQKQKYSVPDIAEDSY